MNNNDIVCIWIGAVLFLYTIYMVTKTIVVIKKAKYQSFSLDTKREGSENYLAFIEWLDEKGIKREGFKSNAELTYEFLEWQDDNL